MKRQLSLQNLIPKYQEAFILAGNSHNHTQMPKNLLLNMQMLVDSFEENYYKIMFYHRNHDVMKLQNFMVYHGQPELCDNVLYLGSGSTFAQFPIENQDISLISLGDPGELYHTVGNSMIVILSETTLEPVINLTSETFHRYQEFDMNLHRILRNGGGLEELGSAALDFFENPLFIHDEKFNYLVRPQVVSGMTPSILDEKTGISRTPAELVNALKADTDYLKTLSTHGAHIWWAPRYRAYRVAYVNIFDDSGRYRGRLCLNEINSLFQPSQMKAAEYFIEIVKNVLFRFQIDQNKDALLFESFLKDILNGRDVDTESILRRISLNSWRQNDTYICMKLSVELIDLAIQSVDNTRSALTAVLPNAYTFYEEGAIWVVENLTAERLNYQEFREHVQHFVSEGHYHTGESNLFHDFLQLKHVFRQAEIALEYGKQNDPRKYYYPFSQYVLFYMSKSMTAHYSSQVLCHEKLLNMLKRDRENGTEYYQTLKTYLECERNSSVTAQTLHLHRSTLQYRLEKIYSLYQIEESWLEDPQVRLYLLNCFQILSS